MIPAGRQSAPPLGWRRRGLAARFVALSLLLFLVIELAGFGVVRTSIDRTAHGELDSELRVGERVWSHLLDTHAQRLHEGAMLLAADFGFRDAVTSREADAATIASALENHGARIGATVGAYLDAGFQLQALHAAVPDLAAMRQFLGGAVPAMSRANGGGRVVLIGGQPYQFVVVPLRAPVTIGWVALGFPLGQALVDDMRALSGLEVSLVAAAVGGPSRTVATTLGPGAAAALGQHTAPWASHLRLGEDEMAVRVVAHEAGEGRLYTVLMRPVDAVLGPFHKVQVVLGAITAMGVALFGLGSVLAARWVTTPLRTLVQAAEHLGRGDDHAPMVGTARPDEIGELARAFDEMRQRVAAKESEMRQLAYVDRLTDMPNRVRLRDALAQAIAAAAAMPGRQVSVISLDLNRFKNVNDVLGYAVGDTLLKAVANRLATEVVRGGDLVARLGGDEFALLLPEAGPDTALAVAQRVAASFEKPLLLEDQTIDLSASLGIACWPDHADDADALLVRAEVAMYGAKRCNEPVLVYDPAMDSASAQTLSLLSELRQAIEAQELRVYLQPKIALADGRLVGAEALVRWAHPSRGLLGPAAFIPFAEQTGFVRQITLWVFEACARDWHALQAHGPVRVSVNLSTRDLIDPELPRKLDAIVQRYEVPESGLCLEITESAIMDDPARSESTLNELSRRGFKLSIDDFGTGYSSLAYLKRLPVNELKIDRSFVMAMERDRSDAKIVRSTIDLAHNLGLTVVAEGIEDAAVLAHLAELDCDEGQGFHMSRPLPVPDYMAWAQGWSQRREAALPYPQAGQSTRLQ